MNCKAKVLAVKDNLAKIELISDRFRVKVGEYVNLQKGSIRNNQQNKLLWKFYNWLIFDAGLWNEGFYDPMALHLNMKAYFLSEKIYDKGQLKAIEESTTTTLTKSAFGQFVDQVDSFMQEEYHINTQPFWQAHEERSM